MTPDTWTIIIIGLAFFGGTFAGTIFGLFWAGRSIGERCFECHYVRFYCDHCKRPGEVVPIPWVSDLAKTPSAKRGA